MACCTSTPPWHTGGAPIGSLADAGDSTDSSAPDDAPGSADQTDTAAPPDQTAPDDGAAAGDQDGAVDGPASASDDSAADSQDDAASEVATADAADTADAGLDAADAPPADSASEVAGTSDATPASDTVDAASAPDQTGDAAPWCSPADLAALVCAGAGVCAGAVPACQNGVPVCNYAAILGYQAEETACDGLDNDCDGQIDWMAAAPPKAPLPGVCGLQLMVCGGVAGWLLPDPLLAPEFQGTETLCDGLDNDCDGQTDAGLTKPNSNALGVCTAAPLQCSQGVWVLPDYPAAGVAFQATETACDGLDNNCDGLTDVLAGPPPPATLSKGVCAGQVQWCAGNLGWQEPDPALVAGYAMGPENACDGQDNDCDGQTDEDTCCPRWQQGGGGPCRLALSANGKVLAWLTHAGAQWLDTNSGELLGADLGRNGFVTDVAVTGNGTQVATVGEGDTLRTVATDGSTAAPGTWPTLQSWVAANPWTALAWAPDGTTLVAGDSKGSLWWWPAQEATPLPLAGHPSAVTAVAIASSIGQGATWLVSGDAGGQLRARPWPAGTAKTLATLPVAVARRAVDGHGRAAVAATGQPGRVLDIASSKLLFTLAASESVAAVRFASDGLTAWGVAPSGTLSQWSTPLAAGAAAPAVVQTVAAPPLADTDFAAVLAVGPGHFYGAARTSGLWRRGFGASAWQHLGGGHVGDVRGLASSGALALSAGDDSLVSRYSEGGTPAGALLGHEGPVLAVAAWPAGAVTAGADYTVRLWDTADPANPINYKTFGLGGPWASHLAVAGDTLSFWAAAGSAAVRVGMQGATIAKKLQAWPAPGPVLRVALAPDDAQLAVATSGSGTAAGYRVLTAATLTQVWARSDLTGSERAIAWVGSRLALAGGPSHLVLVDSATGATVQELAGHSGEVTSLAWHAGSQRLLSASEDGSVRVWSISADKPAKLLGLWTRHSPQPGISVVRAVAWLTPASGGEPLAVSASADGAVMAWTAPN
ncbi:MAG: hypothetical protein HY902_09730 [Deltaproteobacteria bacterium]|nr:hypothetical protein [Deltaproteobacteria bacterium]